MMTLKEFLAEWNDDSSTMVVHTSGSTGEPKPMRVEKQLMSNSARLTCDFLQLHPGDTALLCMSLDYIAGKMMVVRAVERQLRLVCEAPCGHPLATIDEVIDFAAMVPMQVYNSLQVPQERERLSHIRHLIIGGGAIDKALEAEIATLPNAVWSTYGMTETLSHIALRRLNGSCRSDWYRPFKSVHLSLTTEGCLVIDAPMVCRQLLVTNDIAELREELSEAGDVVQLFRIKGRRDNVICSGGIKIQIEEVEACLKPYLRHAFSIVKKPDEKFGEIAVMLSEDADLETVKEICRMHIPHKYWLPKEFLHVEKIPMTETGKPRRKLF